MPYLRTEAKEYFDVLLKQLRRSSISSPGELNFLFAEIINQYLMNHTRNYQTFNDVIGALECNKLEIYRRLAAPYEDKKIAENGDVFDLEASV